MLYYLVLLILTNLIQILFHVCFRFFSPSSVAKHTHGCASKCWPFACWVFVDCWEKKTKTEKKQKKNKMVQFVICQMHLSITYTVAKKHLSHLWPLYSWTHPKNVPMDAYVYFFPFCRNILLYRKKINIYSNTYLMILF